MASCSDQELGKKISDSGNRLLEAPVHVDDLLPLLEEVESYLLMVEQSPPSSLHDAVFSPSKALERSELLSHSDVDVKVAVASCISEITRITAPEIPYSDDTMKEVFRLIVSTFENLHDNTSVSYKKRVSIIETVAKVRSCVLMLDLECDSLIHEMFRHFFKSVRDYHPDIVICSMITIMTMVIEESEDISDGILIPLLDSVKFDNKELSPVAWKLGEKVLQKCAAKLKPYLIKAVKSLGILLNDYSNVVSSIYLQIPEQKHDKVSSKNQVAGEVETRTTADITPKPTSNGVVRAVGDIYFPGVDVSGAETKAEIIPKRRGRKPKPKTNLMEACQMLPSHKETSDLPKAIPTKDVDNDEVGLQSDPKPSKNGDSIQRLVPVIEDGEIKDVALQTPIRPTRKKRRNKSVIVRKRKGSAKRQNKNTPEGKKNPGVEPLGPDRMITAAGSVDGNKSPELADTPKSGSKISDLKKKKSRSVVKTIDSCSKGKPESVTVVEVKVKRRRGRPSLSNVESTPYTEEVQQEMPSTPMPDAELTNVDVQEETTKESSKRKQTPEKDNPPILKSYGPKLVGKRIKVWWPDDEKYYEGVIQSFIPTKKMHKVLYMDDDIEVLDLRNEKWVLVDAKHGYVEGDPGVPTSSTPGSGDRPKKRTKSKAETTPPTEEKQLSSKRERKAKAVDESSGGVKRRRKGTGAGRDGGSGGKSTAEVTIDGKQEKGQKRATTGAEAETATDMGEEEKEDDGSNKETVTTKGRKRGGRKLMSEGEKKKKKNTNKKE